MRKINATQIMTFFVLLFPAIALSVVTAHGLANALPESDLRGVFVFLIWLVLLYLYVIAVFRVFLVLLPMTDGTLGKGSRE